MKVVRLSALRTSHLYPPGDIPGTHFCWRLSWPQGHSVAGRFMSMSGDLCTFMIISCWILLRMGSQACVYLLALTFPCFRRAYLLNLGYKNFQGISISFLTLHVLFSKQSKSYSQPFSSDSSVLSRMNLLFNVIVPFCLPHFQTFYQQFLYTCCHLWYSPGFNTWTYRPLGARFILSIFSCEWSWEFICINIICTQRAGASAIPCTILLMNLCYLSLIIWVKHL
jgi:hypothetical protein